MVAGLFAGGFLAPVGVNLLAEHGQQAAVAQLGFARIFQLLQARVYQVRKGVYGVGTV